MDESDLSPPWDGTRDGFDAILMWWGDKRGRLHLHWAGMLGWQLLFVPYSGGPMTLLTWGGRLRRVGNDMAAYGPDGED